MGVADVAAVESQRPHGRVRTLDITVLAGGPSEEREVSRNSGLAVHEALQRLGHRVVLCDISPDDLSALDRATDFVFIAKDNRIPPLVYFVFKVIFICPVWIILTSLP